MNRINHWLVPDWPAPTNIRAATTLRTGGVSQDRYTSLNPAAHVSDDTDRVRQNRQIIREMLDLPAEPVWLDQIHSNRAVKAANPPYPPPLQKGGRGDLQQADASYTDESGVVCAVLTADCLPLLVCSTDGKQVAAIHAGWRGLLAGVISNTVVAMLNSNAADLSSAKPSPAGQIRRERIWSREERPQGSGQDNPEILDWVTTAWMQEVKQRREQLPRGNQNKEKNLFKSPHPNLLSEGEGVRALESTALASNPSRYKREVGEDLLAWLGPAIGPDCFEVGTEVRDAFLAKSAAFNSAFKEQSNDKWLADIYQLARIELAALGIANVFGGTHCTVTEHERFYSYRRDAQTGRMATLIWRE